MCHLLVFGCTGDDDMKMDGVYTATFARYMGDGQYNVHCVATCQRKATGDDTGDQNIVTMVRNSPKRMDDAGEENDQLMSGMSMDYPEDDRTVASSMEHCCFSRHLSLGAFSVSGFEAKQMQILEHDMVPPAAVHDLRLISVKSDSYPYQVTLEFSTTGNDMETGDGTFTLLTHVQWSLQRFISCGKPCLESKTRSTDLWYELSVWPLYAKSIYPLNCGKLVGYVTNALETSHLRGLIIYIRLCSSLCAAAFAYDLRFSGEFEALDTMFNYSMIPDVQDNPDPLRYPPSKENDMVPRRVRVTLSLCLPAQARNMILFGIKALDEVGNVSPLSNVVRVEFGKLSQLAWHNNNSVNI